MQNSGNNLADLLEETGDYVAARPLLERALQIRERILGPHHPDVAFSLRRLAIAVWAAEGPSAAFPKISRALEIMQKHTRDGLRGLSHMEKELFFDTTAGFVDAFLSLPSHLVPAVGVYDAVLDRKNLPFRALSMERALIETEPDPQDLALRQTYLTLQRQLASATLRIHAGENPAGQRDQVDRLTAQLDSVEAELSRASSAFREARAERTVGFSSVCSVVPKDAVLIDFFLYERYVPRPGIRPSQSWTFHYVAFVLRGGECEEPIRVDLGPAIPIEEDVRRFRETMGRDETDPATRDLRTRYRKALGVRLKATLFPSVVAQAVAEKPRLLISPDGALALLPFAALPGDDDHEFLLETRTLSYVSSGRELLRGFSSSKARTGFHGVGAPAFGVPTRAAAVPAERGFCDSLGDLFQALPGTSRELDAIGGVLRRIHSVPLARRLEGSQATKAALLEAAPQAKVIHLATHAYFAGADCVPPAPAAGVSRNAGVEGPSPLSGNPLLWAGIALAGGNDREKADGILTALEVTGLNLHNAELVVLSACDTGLGMVGGGREVLGLRWAFAYAGARNLVTSLWNVPDAETATLMTHLYTALWQKGLSVPAALRTAQLEMLRAARAQGDPAPHAWAAFVVSGQPNEREGARVRGK